MFSARALYNNSSESPEELTFNQGDVLTVIQRDFNGLSGWWLCFHDGRVGLAPGNRLRILSHVGLDDGVPTGSEQQAQQPVPAGGGVGASRDEQEQRRERQQIIKTLKGSNVNDPSTSTDQQQIDPQEIYDVPPSSLQDRTAAVRDHVTGNSRPEEVIYDVPPTQSEVTYDSPRGHQTLPARVSFAKAAEQTEYQVPSTMRNMPRKVLDNRAWSRSENVPGQVEGTSSGIKSWNGNIHRNEADDKTRVFGNVSENMRSNVSGCGVGNVPNNTYATIPGSASVNFPATKPGNLVENVSGNVLGNVRVCVEDEDEVSSEKSHGGVVRCLSPNTTGKEWQGCDSGQLIYDSICPMNQHLPSQYPENLQVFHPQPNRLHPSFKPTNPQQSWNRHGNSMTLPRLTGDGRSEDSRSPRFGGIKNEARRSAEVCMLRIPELKKRSEYDRDSVLDEYSVPRGCGTLSPTRPHSASNLCSPPRLGYDVVMSPKTAETCRRSLNELDAPRRARIESDNSEFQLSFVDTGIYVDCPQDPESVADLMDSLDRTVRSQVAKVRELCLGFDPASTCRRREADVSQMKLCCVSLRTALKEVADLGTGVLANAMQLTNRDLSETILQQLEVLRTMSQNLGSAVDLVIGTSQGGTPTGRTNRGSLRDALNSLMTLTHDIVSSLATMTELVGKNSPMVFPQPKSLPPPQIPLAICGVQEFRAASPLTPLSQETHQKFRAASPLVIPLSPLPVTGFPREGGAGSPIPPAMIQIPGPGSVRELQSPSPVNPSSHPPVAVGMREMRAVSPIPPSSPTVFSVSDTPLSPRTTMVAKPYPAKIQPNPHIRNRPLPPLPFGETILLGTSNSAELNAEDNDYAAIANEAELDLRRNVCALVGRLADRSGVNAESKAKPKSEVHEVEHLRPEMGSTTGRNLGGLSPQFKERLDALRPNTEQTMRITCARSRDASPSSSNPEAIKGFFSEFLVGIDREIVHFYADEVRGHFAAVDSATRDFLFAVGEGKVNGSEVVALSRTVVLAAHKLVYASDAITKKLMGDEELRRQVGVIAKDLCLRLRETVAASKAAAAAADAAATDVGLGYNQREQMLNCMREVKYLSLQLRDVIFAHLLEKIY